MDKKIKEKGYVKPLAAAISLLLSGSAFSVEFSSGDLEGSFNSNISMGASWSMEDPKSELVAGGNGGSGLSTTTDDGKLNFKKGQTFSEIVKGVHDLSLSKGNYGAFMRGKYWYDRRLQDQDVERGHLPTGYSASGQKLDDSSFDDLQKFSGVALLDAYIYGSFDIGDAPLDLRLGKQVVSWGESTFIQGGVNSINPVDVNAFRRPGAEVKEGLLPVNMIYANIGATENLTLEAFYQLTWQETVVDGCGTFFSGADVLTAEGCDKITASGAVLNETTAIAAGAYLKRVGDQKPEDKGQYGIAARYFAADLNETEFGLYYMKYHNRTPILSVNGSAAPPQIFLPPVVPAPVVLPDFASASYFIEYPEGVDLYGLSFNTSLGDISVSGELSYRPNQPVQENTTNLLFKSLGLAGGGAFLNQTNHGYDELPVTQAQMTMVKFFDQVLGASRLTMLGEVGYSKTGDLDKNGKLYGRSPVFGNPTADDNEGTVTENAWGYRMLAALSYSNVFAGVNMTPKIAFSHDVDGYSANGMFVEGRQSVNMGLSADYLNTYTAGISYTSFWGGDYNTGKDRDFASFSLGVSF